MMRSRRQGFRQESDVLLRQLDGHLAALRAGATGRPKGAGATGRLKGAGAAAGRARAAAGATGRHAHPDLAVAERIAAALRRLVSDTNLASAADRARVRAAVRVFVSRGGTRSGGYAPGLRSAPGRYGLLPAPGRRDNRRTERSLGDEVRIVNDILGDLGTGLA